MMKVFLPGMAALIRNGTNGILKPDLEVNIQEPLDPWMSRIWSRKMIILSYSHPFHCNSPLTRTMISIITIIVG
jgi:hypothetical protein